MFKKKLIQMLQQVWQLRLLRFFLIIIFLLLVIYMAIPLPQPLFPKDYSTVILDDQSQILRVYLNERQQWCFPPSDSLQIPQKLKTAVLTFEDRHFYRHFGVNPFSLVRAVKQNIQGGRTVSGASTITMQVARLIKNKPRTYFNKMLEILQALKIELNYSKEDILKTYLDHAPYGGNIVGYRAAARKYFGRKPTELTWSEAATLAVLPNAPGLISPDRNRQALKNKRDFLLKKLHEEGYLDAEELQLAMLENLPEGSISFPAEAPHVCDRIMQNPQNGEVVHTTINLQIQRDVEYIAEQHMKNMNEYGIRNCAVLVARTGNGEIKAYLGSNNYMQAFVDGVTSPRSTASTLKPFLYALSMDEGIILPQTMMRDIPSYFGDFSPSNANHKFSGLVPAEEALIQSLNVPAVRLLYTLGLHPFYLFLQKAGLNSLFRSADDYGLPLILGGAESSLWDLVKMFRSLGNLGTFSDITYLRQPQGEITPGKRLISSGACYLTLQILRNLRRPGAEYYWEQYRDNWPLAWKTGTSYGYRDAWAIGVSSEWTIGIWIGNFNGESNTNLIGSHSAGPLLFDIFNYLPKTPGLAWFKKPEKALTTVEVCAETGFRANEYCLQKIEVDAPLGAGTLEQCPFHQPVFLNKDHQYQVCSLCWEPGEYEETVLAIYPPDLSQFLRENGKIVNRVPPHLPTCPALQSTDLLTVVYPTENARLWIPRDLDGELQKVTFHAAHQLENQQIYWYVDNRYCGMTRKIHNMAMQFEKGWHNLEIVDGQGNRSKRRFFVMHN